MEATVDTLPVSFTTSAIIEVRRLMEELNLSSERALRVGVKGGGCSGMTYVLDFDNIEANDAVYEFDGIRVAMDPRHVLYVMGMEVDYSGGLNARGFEFKNPNAKTTCGCGTSFSA
jgi:iron-sulfur cluster assembly protein